MEDKYSSFKDLSSFEVEGKDFRVVSITRVSSGVIVIAPHGGEIEPRTSDLARSIAGSDYSCYCFEGTKDKGNRELHITSHRFDEPRGTALVKQHEIVIAIHGARETGERVLLGGLDKKFGGLLATELAAVGINAEQTGHAYKGEEPLNICNRGSKAAGVQIELTMEFRIGESADKFVETVRSVLAKHPIGLNGNNGAAHVA